MRRILHGRPSGRGTLLVLAAAAAMMGCGLAAPAGAQEASRPPPPTARAILPTPYVDPEGASEFLDELVARSPDDVALLLALARELTAVGILAPTKDSAAVAYERAAEVAGSALARDSTNADSHYWYAAARGLHADREGGRTKITLATEAHTHTLRALELDPDHGGAHHVLGRLHAGAKRLGFATRQIARLLGLGEIISEATWETAEHHMRVAVEREPSLIVHHYELGLVLCEVGKTREGAERLQELAARRPRHEIDAFYVARTLEALDSSVCGT